MSTIYQEILLEHYKNPKNKKHLKHFTKKATVYNSLCGDKVTIEILFDGDKVKDIGFSGNGCIISQAMASQLTEKAKHLTKNQLRKLDTTYIMKLLGINLGPNRLKCALLSLDALKKSL